MNQNATALLFEGTPVYQIHDSSAMNTPVAGDKPFKILLLHNSGVQLPVAERQMLGKMLAALKLNWEDVALISGQPESTFHHLRGSSMCFNKMIAFGFTPATLGMNIAADNYRLLNFQDTQIIFSESLSILSQNLNSSKDRLWKAVKEMFAQ